VTIAFTNPTTGNDLVERSGAFFDAITNQRVASVREGIPRFVDSHDDYAENFGWQWHHWSNTLSDSRSPSNANSKRRLLLERTHFDSFDLAGKTILECGMGGGDDTEVLLQFPFAEVHAFDLSRAVDRAKRTITDPRLTLSQADIFAIPYADQAFDFVFCHRVLQHTPDPTGALRHLCRKVKPGGVLFVHSYHWSPHFMMGYKYKYRWLTKRVPMRWVSAFLDRYGASLYAINEWVGARNSLVKLVAHNTIPFERLQAYGDKSREERLELGKLVTFDALTPKYDKPMTWRHMRKVLTSEGMSIRFSEHRPSFPLWCTSVRVDEPA